MGTVGRTSGQVRLRVAHTSDQDTLSGLVHQFTGAHSHLCTDEWVGYAKVSRRHSTVDHEHGEWARDDDGDGLREVHVNTLEGLWTSVRNFLRPFRGVHKRYLSQYIAMCEFGINLKRVSPAFVSAWVTAHQVWT